MTKKERLDVIVAKYRDWSGWVDNLAAAREDQLDSRRVERIDQMVRQLCGELVRAADDLRGAAGVEPRRTGRARLALSVEKINKVYQEELRNRAGKGKVAVVESVARRFRVSKRTIYRVLVTLS